MHDVDYLLEDFFYNLNDNDVISLESSAKLYNIIESTTDEEIEDLKYKNSILYKKYGFNPDRGLTVKEKSDESVNKILNSFRERDLETLKKIRKMTIKMIDGAINDYEENKVIVKLKRFVKLLAATVGVTLALILLVPVVAGAMTFTNLAQLFRTSSRSEEISKATFQAATITVAALNQVISEKETKSVNESWSDGYTSLSDKIYDL